MANEKDYDRLIEKISTLERSNVEFQVTLKFLKEQIEQYHNCVNDVNVINITLKNTIDHINKLENTYKEAIESNEELIKKIGEKITALDNDIQKLPMTFEKKGKSRDIFEYLKVAPAILTVTSAIITGLWLYIQKFLV